MKGECTGLAIYSRLARRSLRSILLTSEHIFSDASSSINSIGTMDTEQSVKSGPVLLASEADQARLEQLVYVAFKSLNNVSVTSSFPNAPSGLKEGFFQYIQDSNLYHDKDFLYSSKRDS